MALSPLVKAVLLSALVLPGAGQYANGERVKGTLFTAGTLGALAYVFIRLVRTVLSSIPLDLDPTDVARTWALATAIHKQVYGELVWPIAFLLVLWVASTLDAYVVARRRQARGA